MPRLLLSLLFLTLTTPAFAQGSNNTPNQPQLPGAPVAILHAGTKLVIVDVVVTDRKHKPVQNLKASDFTVLENNSSQQLKSFEEHSARSTAEEAKIEPMPQMASDVFTNFTPAPASGALNVLLIDKLNTLPHDQARLRQELMDYIRKVKPGTRIAIFALTNKLVLLQGFTDDPAMLRPALEKKAAAAFAPVNPYQDLARITDTAGAISQLGRYLSSIPGRKNLIWFSGNFPLNPFPISASRNPLIVIPDTSQQFHDINDLLTQSEVAVYPVDASGLMPMPSASVASSGAGFVHHPATLAAGDRAFVGAKFDEHTIMQEMAFQTGGRAFFDTNGLTDAVDSAIDDGSNYYTLAYTPADENWNGNFRKIEVRLRQQGYDLSYRHGYYATNPDTQPAGSPHKPGRPGSNSMRLALMYGSPEPTQIVFTVQVLPMSNAAEDTLVPGNEGSANLKGPYRRYGLNIAADPRSMSFTTSPGGMHHGAVEFVAFVYDAGGKLINALGTPVNTDFNDALFLKALQHGIPFHEELSIPAKGEYFIRVVVHDLKNDHVGAVEVPISSVRDLPPITASAPKPTPIPN